MDENTYRLTITVTVSKGRYGYVSLLNKEFEITAPPGILRKISISQSVDNLFQDALDGLEALPEDEADQ